MKKERFIDLVCERLCELGASENEIAKQRLQINGYLTGLGIGEEAEELDYESPKNFADEIFEIIKAHRPNVTEQRAYEEVTEEEDDDVKVFDPNAFSDIEELPEIMGDDENNDDSSQESDIGDDEENDPSADYTDLYDELGDELESEHSEAYDDEDIIEQGATREYNLQDLISEEFEETDENDDDYYEEDVRITGNSVFFWILTVVLAPVWIPLAALAAVLSVALFVLLSVFIVIYIPLLIVLILGGSAAVLAELIYSIVKFVTGQIHIGLFELGLGFFISALVLCLSVIIYRFGTKYAPKVWKNYWKRVSKLFRKLKRLVRKLKGVCSI